MKIKAGIEIPRTYMIRGGLGVDTHFIIRELVGDEMVYVASRDGLRRNNISITSTTGACYVPMTCENFNTFWHLIQAYEDRS